MHSASDTCRTIGVRALVAELAELPANPAVALRVLQLLDDPRTDAGRLARLVESDPALAAHALRLANAPLRRTGEGITSARQAVGLVGFELVRSLASLATLGTERAGGDPRLAAPPTFWRHSVMTASACVAVARRTGHDEGEACSAGLLHDLGSALQYRAAPGPYEAMLAEAGDDPAAQVAAELGHFELDHADAGAAVLDTWGFPAALVAVARDHHRPPTPTTPDLVLIVRAGEAIAGRLEAANACEALIEADVALDMVGIDPADSDEVLAEAVEESDGVAAYVLGARD